MGVLTVEKKEKMAEKKVSRYNSRKLPTFDEKH